MDGQKVLIAWAAVSFQPTTSRKQILGSIKFVSDTRVSATERLVGLSNFTIAESHFPDLPMDQDEQLVADLQAGISQGVRVIALDEVLAGLEKGDVYPHPPVGRGRRPAVDSLLQHDAGTPRGIRRPARVESDC